jgi:hypothetical protein
VLIRGYQQFGRGEDNAHARIHGLMFAHQSFGHVRPYLEKNLKNTHEDNAHQRTAQKEYIVIVL